MIDIDAHFDTATNTVTYVVTDVETKVAVIIDPVLDYDPHRAALDTDSADKILAGVRARGLILGRRQLVNQIAGLSSAGLQTLGQFHHLGRHGLVPRHSVGVLGIQ